MLKEQTATNGSARPPASYDRTPPHHLDAEVAVLGSALLSRAALAEVVEVVKPEDFYKTGHRLVFEAILELYARGEVIDPITLVDRLGKTGGLDDVGGATRIHDLVASVPTAANALYYARIVREKAVLRRLIDAGTQVVQIGYEGDEDVNVSVDRAEQLIYDVAQGRVSNEFSPLKELLSEGLERIEQRYENHSEVTGLATGLDDLDRITAGLQPQNLVILAARPAVGKSSLALGIAHYVTVQLRRPAIIFSLEMSKGEIVDRMLASEARVDSFKIRTGRLSETDWASLSDAVGRLDQAPLFIDDTAATTLMEIRSKCRRLKHRQGLDLVVVDYLQLMQSHRRVDNRVQEVSEISRGLKMLAKELEVPVLALSQLSRQTENRTDKRPQLADLRESGCLTPETRILRADTGRWVSLGELHASGAKNIPVWTLDHNYRLSRGTMTHVFSSGTKPVYRLRLRSGRRVDASANHPFLTFDGWRRLDELRVGQRVAVPRTAPDPLEPTRMDHDEIVLLAHLIGDGCAVERQPLHYTSADEANLEAVAAAARSRFGIEARRRPDGRSDRTTQLYLPAPFPLTHGRRNPIAAWLDGLGLFGRRSHEKFVPDDVFGLPRQDVALFLRHLWATDGSITIQRSGNGRAPSIYYATSSERLALDLQLLLLRIDINARVRSYPQGRDRPAFQVWVEGSEEQRRFLAEVGCHGARAANVREALEVLTGVVSKPSIDTLPIDVWALVDTRRRELQMTHREFATAVGRSSDSGIGRGAVSRPRLATIAGALSDDHLAQLARSDLLWDEIAGIEAVGDREVFDATVLGTHNFLAEGVIVENSIEQDSDIVMFIYRDDVYDHDSVDKGTAELHIAKHRNGPTGVVKLAFLDHITKFANLARTTV